MNFRKLLILLLSILTFSGMVLAPACSPVPAVAGQVIEDVSTVEAHGLVQENAGNTDFVVLDVRTPEEYNSGHVSGAVNLDFYRTDFSVELGKLDRDKEYLLYCRTGNRSGQALEMMRDMEFLTIYHMNGGISDWNARGLPLEN